MAWIDKLNKDPLPWLMEKDDHNPGVRYFTLRELLELPEDDKEVQSAQKALMQTGPVPQILKNQDPEGFWVEPGPGYYPKYTGTVWQIIFLAQFGADENEPHIQQAGNYVLNQGRSSLGGFSLTGTQMGMVHCLQGNLCAGLLDLGFKDDPRLAEALMWLARSITGEDIGAQGDKEVPVRYLKSGNCGPGFLCSANNQLPCAWGAVKAMLALSKIPPDLRSKSVQDAIQTGVDFLFDSDPALADYPMGYAAKPSRSWFQFGFPIGYVTDVLQNLEVLTAFGFGQDPRLANAVELVLNKQDNQGRWKLEYTYNGKTWVDVELKGKPSKWVTLRALRVLKRVFG